MPLTENLTPQDLTIQSYTPGTLMVNHVPYQHSLLLTPTRHIDWSPQTVSELKAADFDRILAEQPEVFILGTGAQQHFPPLALFAQLMEKHIGYEVMDTAAACRTYNLLISEGRRVVAGLIIR